ncbi:oxidoreductase [Amycolatopsis acidicola]|uniref:Oxidoreductase n=1 Tax=Amycolatopsis acidicola TaxID=2596893 RepID=A0A5N0V4I2_9PSEU|nr:acyl-CoA dehydrogenase family protein [Amycolatopsis acidicola]KAA9160885.1 oxidoreductase [Amycolatopsis acidicola]
MTITPTSAELVARVRELHPLLAANAAQGEAERRVADESIKALDEAGVFRLAQPERYGGFQTPMRTLLDVSSAVGEADGGTAWVVSICNVSAWMAGLFPQRAQDEVWADDPRAKVTGVLAPTAEATKVDGGYRVTGKWFFNSGSWHSDWALLGFPVTDDAGQVVDQGLALMPKSDYTVEETWFVAGMKSTGSNCVVVTDRFVPAHRVLSVPAAVKGEFGTEHTGEALYRSAFAPFLTLVVAGPHLGMGRKVLEIVREKAATKAVSHTSYSTQASSVGFQLKLAEAAMSLDTAHLHAYRAADDIDSAAARGERLDFLTRARIRADIGWVVEHVTKAVDILLYSHGAGSFAEANVLQRFWRDSAVGARHAGSSPVVGYEVYGKALLGVDELITPLI